ncbi:sodium:phosphate symporter [Haladaptatus sp. T7]|uniref:sodium:phosphate symporter n=1 Tax=Haladaptatus sp. T7 TaxID=2029368 RepID=UPI0021A2533E|nr:sodium:phosphate symporter [Haladaptatus sp. T7]GKZ12315.1 hypothetical protein HAL_01960 [Haladaptatus sp. T7]
MPEQPTVVLSVRLLVTILLFLFAIRLLGATTDALAPFLQRNLRRVVVGDAPALGASWFASYVLANGSIVAALSLSLFSSHLIVPSQLFLMIIGSRLGAAAIVIFIGTFDYLNEELDSLRESVSMGLLAFLLTHSIYLPVLVVGYLSMPLVQTTVPVERTPPATGASPPDVFSALTGSLIDVLGAGVAFIVAILCIFLSMRLFDRILKSLDKQRLRRRYLSRLQNKWASFFLGLVITGLTTSVAFSLGVIVPLYNRGHVKRNEIIPYILGANIGTLVDTLIIAVALDTPVGVLTVVLLLSIGLLVTLLTLVLYPLYTPFIDVMQNEIVGTKTYFIGFLLTLLVVPLLLIVLG